MDIASRNTKFIIAAVIAVSATAGGVALAGQSADEVARTKYNEPRAAPAATINAVDRADTGMAAGVARGINDAKFALVPGSIHHATSADGASTTVGREQDGSLVMAVTGNDGGSSNVGKSLPADVARGRMVLAVGGTDVGGGRMVVGAVVPDGVKSVTLDLVDGTQQTLAVQNGIVTGFARGAVRVFHFTGTDGIDVGTAFSQR